MKTAKATVTALLYTSKTLANGEHPVMIRVCYNGRRKYKSTGLSCPARLWNAAKQEVRGRHPLSVNMNALIESELTRLKNKVLDYERQGMAYSVQSLLEASGRKPPSRKTLDDLFEERIAYFRDSMQKHNTAAGYQTLRHIIGRYSPEPDGRAVRRGQGLAAGFRTAPPYALRRHEHKTLLQRIQGADELRLPKRPTGRKSVPRVPP